VITALASWVCANEKYQGDGSAMSVWWCHAPGGLDGEKAASVPALLTAVFLLGSSVVYKTRQLSASRTGVFQVPPALSPGSRLG